MGPNDRTSSPMSWFGNELPNWNEVSNSDGSHAGSNERVAGGTQHYDSHGNRSGFTSNDGSMYDADGNLASPDYDPYD